MSDRAYVLINVLPGQTSNVVKSLKEIKEIKNIDPCWTQPTSSSADPILPTGTA